MAKARCHGTTTKSFPLHLRGSMALVLGLMTLVGFDTALGAQHTVGESIGWGLGNDLQSWASQRKFSVGDDLYFPYPSGQHSVLLVTEEDYKSCNIQKPITSDNGMGDMVITLSSEETYYFICGVPGHCEQGLRLSIAVEHDPTLSTADSTKYNTFHRNASPEVSIITLANIATMIFSIFCTLVLL